ncbi:MAG: hypothetical protein Q9174_006116 [Haloplaca sp. 1 TL-2023]
MGRASYGPRVATAISQTCLRPIYASTLAPGNDMGYPMYMYNAIYAIFVMLEAVRLVEPIPVLQEKGEGPESALVIGLGIGTTPSALIAHGINTTIVEIDPMVYSFATKYFGLPSNHTPVIQDAIAFVNQNWHTKKYTYIIHDVFTGGAEPIDLFTVEFLTGLRAMLQPNGVIAINYAGDPLLPTFPPILRTILSAFPSCRFYREEPLPPPSPSAPPPTTDFTNLVAFCRWYPGPITFRPPVETDFLNTGARKWYLLPKYEVLAEDILMKDGKGKGGGERKDVISTRMGRKARNELEKWQIKGAIGHWGVMRGVLPAPVWENW